MIEIPEGEQRKVFRQNYVHGAIFLYEKFVFEDKTSKSKFIIVLNPCDEDGNSHFYLATSRTSKLLSNPVLRDSCYLIPVGEVSCFKKETIISIRSIHSRKYANVEQKYIKHESGESLIYKQKMPANIMSDIKELILDSNDITPIQKLKIYPAP